MMRSLYSAVSGLKNQQSAMDVIGNNVANVNTTGFKASRTLFQDIFSQTVSSASAPTANSGGVNAKQIGLGVTTAAVATDMTEGSTQSTGNTLDFAISGEGFFVVKASDGSYYYTRNGNFTVDSEGYLVTQNGDYVMGKVGTGTMTPTTPTTSFTLKNGATSLSGVGTIYASTNTAGVKLTTPVEDTATAANDLLTTGNYDGSYSITCTATTTSGTTTYSWTATNGTKTLTGTMDSSNGTLTFSTDDSGSTVNLFSISLENTSGTALSAAPTLQAGTLKSAFKISTKTSSLVISGLDDDNSNLSLDTLQKLQITGTIDSTGEYGSNYYGTYSDYSIDKYGVVTAERSADDGTTEKVTLGRVALATFANSAGLEKSGDSNYSVSANSGDATVNFVGVDCGTASSGVLEMSNVQLASEMTNMIVTQRAFQANSRVITTSDSMLEELVNLKRS